MPNTNTSKNTESKNTSHPKIGFQKFLVKENRISNSRNISHRKYITASVLLLALLITAVTFAYAGFYNDKKGGKAYSGSGLGTVYSPYKISDCSQLQEMADNPTAHYALISDINCSGSSGWNAGQGFEPIGSEANPFTGSLEGYNFTISNLTINRPSATTPVGIFGTLGHPGTGGNLDYNKKIRNVLIDGANITGGNGNTGTIAGKASNALIENVKVTNGSVVSKTTTESVGSGQISDNTAGGLIGYYNLPIDFLNKGKIINSSYQGSITSGNIAGGIVGKFYGKTAYARYIKSSYANANITLADAGSQAGGIVGVMSGGILQGNYSAGSITDSLGNVAKDVGGIVGRIQSAQSETNTVHLHDNISLSSMTAGSGGILGRRDGSVFYASSSTYYYRQVSGQNACSSDGTYTACSNYTALSSFYGTASSPPYGNLYWDFTNIWQTNVGGPPTHRPQTEFTAPDGISELISSAHSQSSISLAWKPPVNDGNSDVLLTSNDINYVHQYAVEYRKQGDPTWITATRPDTSNIDNYYESIAPNPHHILSGLEPNTNYEVRIAAISPIGQSTWSATLITSTQPNFTGNGVGSATQAYEITTCEELQQINNDLTAHYVLVNDIDCSGSSSLNDNRGFIPIGSYKVNGKPSGSVNAFRGTLDGRNHAINNLTVDTSSTVIVSAYPSTVTWTEVNTASAGLFISIQNGIVVNLRLVGGSINTDVNEPRNFFIRHVAAGLAVDVNYSIVQNVSSSQTIIGGLKAGGLIGTANSSDTMSYFRYAGSQNGIPANTNGSLERLVFTGAILPGTQNNQSSYHYKGLIAGEMWGASGYESPLQDSYATGSLDCTMVFGACGGLIGRARNTDLKRVYSAGQLENAPSWDQASGLISSLSDYDDPQNPGAPGSFITDSFSDLTSSDQYIPCSGLIGTLSNSSPTANIQNSFYNGTGCASDSLFGTRINSRSHFQGNNSNPPFTNWDFNGYWQQNANNYPTLRASGVPGAPPTLFGDWVANDSLQLRWLLQQDNGGSTITDYVIEYKPTSSGTWTTVSHPPLSGTDNFTISGLTSNTDYDFRLKAVNVAGQSAPTTYTATAFDNLSPIAPYAPYNLTAIGDSPDSITAYWAAPLSNGGSPVTEYLLEYRETLVGGSWTSYGSSISAGNLSQAVTGLTRNTSYDFRVAAVNAYGQSGWSATVSAATTNDALSAPLVNTDAAWGITETSASLSGDTTPAGITGRGFQWGTSASYGQSITDSSALSYGYKTKFGTSGSGNGQMLSSHDVTVDTAGNTYVVDNNNDRIQKFDPNGNYLLQWGSSGSGNGQFRSPTAIDLDSAGNVYVVDGGNDGGPSPTPNVQKFDSNGNFISKFGSYGSGNGQLNTPLDIIVLTAGTIVVTDTGNNRVQKFDNSGNYISQFGVAGLNDGQLNFPRYLDDDSAGNLYVSDGGGSPRVQKFDSNGSFILKWGSTGSGDGQFSSSGPTHVTIDVEDSVFVTDTGNHRVQKFSSTGTYVSQFGSGGSGDGQLLYPRGTFIRPNGTIVVADTLNNRVQTFTGAISANLTGLTCGTTYHYRAFATNLAGTRYGNDATFTTSACAQLLPEVKTQSASAVTESAASLRGITSPRDVIEKGFEFGLDTNYGSSTIDSTDASPDLSFAFGASGIGPGEFSSPGNIAIDSLNNIYIADPWNQRIQKFDAQGNYILEWGSYGTGNLEFITLRDIAIDSNDNIYSVDSYNQRVQKFDSDGNYLLQWGSPGGGNGQFQTVGPRGIAIDKTDNTVYVSDINADRVQKFDSDGNYLLQWGSTGNGNGQFDTAFGLAVDSSGDVYVGDPSLNRVQKFTSTGSYLLSWGTTGSGNGEFSYLSRLATDSADRVYTQDSADNRIQVFDSTGSYLDQFGQNGTGEAILTDTAGISIDNNDEVYVSEFNSNRIKKFAEPISKTINSLTCSTTYHFRAYASTASATEYGDDNTFTTSTCTNIPSAPQNFYVAPGITSAYLTWEAPTSTGGSPITDYLVEYKLSSDSNWTPYPNVVSTTTNTLIEGLTSGIQYDFRVFAVNVNGTGPEASITATTFTDEIPVLSGTASATRATLSWTEILAISYYQVEYKESSSSEWGEVPVFSDTTTNGKVVYPLTPNTVYDFRVRADYTGGQYGSWSNTLTLSTLPQQNYSITNCRQLQAIAIDPLTLAPGDLEGNYTIANDIDCSETTTWEWETLINDTNNIIPTVGFLPIYGYDQDFEMFSGNINGQNHKITNLYQYNINYAGGGLISFAVGGSIRDLHLENAEMLAPASFATGGILANSLDSRLSNLSFTGTINASSQINAPLGLTRTFGSIVGLMLLSDLEESWADSSISVGISPSYTDDTPTESFGIISGGLVGISQNSTITNSYADGSISMSGNPDFNLLAGGLAGYTTAGYVGGFYRNSGAINASYASTNLSFSDNSSKDSIAGGLVGIVADAGEGDGAPITESAISISNTFANGSISGNVALLQVGTGKGGLIGVMQGDLASSILSNNYYDNALTSTQTCVAAFYSSLYGIRLTDDLTDLQPNTSTNAGDCAGVNVANAQPDYFINNTCNPPLNTWDFTNIWRAQTLAYPSLDQPRSTSLRSCDTLSPLNPDGGETPGGGTTTTPTGPGTITRPIIPSLPFLPGTLIPLPNEDSGNGFAPSARKAPTPAASNWLSGFLPEAWTKALRMMPEDTARVIPFLLIFVLIATALFYARQAWVEYRNVARVNALLSRYQATQEANRNFVALTSHYLNTPVNILQSSVELITSLKALTPENSAKLKLAIDNLAHDVRAMVSDSQTSTKHVAESRLELSKLKAGVIVRNLHVIMPIILTLTALFIANLLFTQTDRYALSGIMLIGQLLAFTMACVGIFVAYRSYRRNQLSHTALKHQLTLETDLLSRRVEFITKSYDGLNADLGFIQHYGTLIPKTSPVQKPFNNGLAMLGAVLAKFHALIEFSKPLEAFPAPLSVAPLVDAASQTYKAQVTEKKLTIKNTVPVGLVLPLSQAALEQLIYSTVENAIKFNRPNGSVNVSTHITKAGIILSIDDTGIGIPKAKLAQLMTPFSRATDVLKFDYEGIGLNLYLNKVLVEQYGGKMTLISRENKGTSVIYQLPSVEVANHGNHTSRTKTAMHTPLFPAGAKG